MVPKFLKNWLHPEFQAPVLGCDSIGDFAYKLHTDFQSDHVVYTGYRYEISNMPDFCNKIHTYSLNPNITIRISPQLDLFNERSIWLLVRDGYSTPILLGNLPGNEFYIRSLVDTNKGLLSKSSNIIPIKI